VVFPLRPTAVVQIALAMVALATVALAETPYVLPEPRGFPPEGPNIPADNPLTWERVELGRFLFYDKRLSGNQTFACASCHEQALGFTDGRARAIGSTGELHPRSSMSLVNIAFAGTLAWANNLLFALEEQALIPMFGEHPIELGLVGREQELFARLRADTRYQRLFAEAYPGATDPVTLDTITKALASFERTLISGNTPYERYAYGIDDNAISAAAKRGEFLFFKDPNVECFHCHGGFNFTSSVDHMGSVAERTFHNNGLYNLRCADFGLPDLILLQCNTTPPAERCDGRGPQAMGCYPPDNTGLYDVSHTHADMGRFKAPSLRNITVTAPYMHDGSIATLPDVIEHYAAGGRTISDGEFAGVGSDSPLIGQFIRGFTLTQRQKDDLLAFLESLTDDDFLTNPRFADPFAPVACPGDCDLDGSVAINELVAGVGISLETSTLGVCVVSDVSGDGAVTVDEIIRATLGALGECSS